MNQSSSDVISLMKAVERRDAPPPDGLVETNARTRFAVAKALAQGRMRFAFQPVVQARVPRFPAFYEMLARLHQPDGRVLEAERFLPVVAGGLLGRSVDRLALAEAVARLDADRCLRLSINIAVAAMGDEEWLQALQAAARTPGICERLILEIDESEALAHIDQTLDFMGFARALGCSFGLDHFGAGATGFRHFRAFRFDLVKLDGAIVNGVAQARDAQVLVECLLAVGKHFEMFTVAENVEAQADADWLCARGVDCLQGYLLGAPVAEPIPPRVAAAPGPSAAAG